MIKSVSIPDSATEIGKDAFGGCSNLTEITIPDSIKKIGRGAAFTDVNSGDWYYEAAGFVSSRGIMTGMNPSEFGPSVKLSRAQFATILYRMESEP